MSYLISPPYCASCRESIQKRTIFCINCFDSIKPIISKQLHINKGYSVTVIAISDYKEPLKSLILAKKSSNFLASRQLGQLIWQLTNIRSIDFDYIVPIPLHFLREITRGYNQTEVIAEFISKESNKPVVNLLKRSKFTKYQLSLNKNDRTENLRDAFDFGTVDKTQVFNKHILLVDDLFTTGSTLIEAANKLVYLNPKTITAVVVSRVI